MRLAESAPDFSQVISTIGRYVTHGIFIETDSVRLQPESGAVIKSVAQDPAANPTLKLMAEGHTDAMGKAQHNLDPGQLPAQSRPLEAAGRGG